MAVVVLLAGVVIVALVGAGAGAVDAARARTAADAAALAGAADGREAAEAAARANGARLIAYIERPGDVTVTVRVRRRGASARAEVEGTWCDDGRAPGTGSPYTSHPCPWSPG